MISSVSCICDFATPLATNNLHVLNFPHFVINLFKNLEPQPGSGVTALGDTRMHPARVGVPGFSHPIRSCTHRRNTRHEDFEGGVRLTLTCHERSDTHCHDTSGVGLLPLRALQVCSANTCVPLKVVIRRCAWEAPARRTPVPSQCHALSLSP